MNLVVLGSYKHVMFLPVLRAENTHLEVKLKCDFMNSVVLSNYNKPGFNWKHQIWV